MGQDTHQHEHPRSPRGVPQMRPVPLAFLTRRMIDDRHRLAPGAPTRPTRRAQLPVTDLANERHIALPVPQSLGFDEQRRSPQVRILGQPLTNIRFEPVERIPLRRSPLPEGPLTRKVSSYCLSVSSQMAGNSRDRPSPFPQRVYFHVFLLCQHQRWGSLSSLPDLTPSSLERTPLSVWYLGLGGGEFQ